jgi:hypothetical protein
MTRKIGPMEIQSWHRCLVFCHHLISLFARASTFGGIVTPICFAVFRLITSSKFVGCSTGRSAVRADSRQIRFQISFTDFQNVRFHFWPFSYVNSHTFLLNNLLPTAGSELRAV